MKKKLRWRYYCDYCKKSTGTPQSMEHHEERCTLNPNRKCGLCLITDGGYGYIKEGLEVLKFYSRLIAKNPLGNEDLSIEAEDELRKATNNCPICMYAALRQSNFEWTMPGFDFFKEKEDSFKSAMNDLYYEDYLHSAYKEE
jgi:hypothetical protein